VISVHGDGLSRSKDGSRSGDAKVATGAVKDVIMLLIGLTVHTLSFAIAGLIVANAIAIAMAIRRLRCRRNCYFEIGGG